MEIRSVSNRVDKREWSRIINNVEYRFYYTKTYCTDGTYVQNLVYREDTFARTLVPVHYFTLSSKELGGE